ncbi:DUF397 domain-containing protein [Streptomyces asiaticus]
MDGQQPGEPGAIRTDTVHIRDSKTPQGGRLTVSPEAWAAFIAHI